MGRGRKPMGAKMVEYVERLRRRVFWLERKAGTRLEGLGFLLRTVQDPGRV